mgnify:CR=1 FL=1
MKKSKSKNKKELEIGTNAAIVIGLVIVFVGYYVVSNPITTGVVLFLGVIVAGIAVAGHYFGGGIVGMLGKLISK